MIKLHSNYDSVQEQSGIFAGPGGFDITVGEHTQLDGAVIASTATADKNTLDTGTLGFSNIENKADFKAEHQGGSLSTGGPVGSDLLSNLGGVVLSGLGNDGHAAGTTQAAVSDGTITIRDLDKQQQNVDDLSRDTDNANGSIGPIFDKEKEQNRLKEAQLIGEIGGQAMDIARTHGDILGLDAALKANPTLQGDADALRETKEYKAEMQKYGTGSALQQGLQAATAAIQGLAGGNMAQALAGASAPYLAEIIKKSTGDNQAANLMAHAVLGAVVAQINGNSALAGAAGAAMGEYIAQQMYPGIKREDLTEEQRQTISALGTLAAGLAGGLTGDSSADAVAGAQAGKNAVENNFLSTTSSTKRDELAEKVLQGDKTLQTAKEFLQLENADKRSDALVAKFNEDPAGMTSGERAELTGYLMVYASEMQAQYGEAVTKELITGMLTGQAYLKSTPQTEAQQKAQTIMNTWGYHKSNASIGDPVVLYGLGPLGNSIKAGMLGNAAIGVGVNTAVQLGGKDPFNYVDAMLAGVTAAATTGKGIGVSAGINMGGAALGSAVKGEDPTNSTIGAGVGSVLGSVGGTIIKGSTSTVAKESISDLTGAVGGSYISEKTGNLVKDTLEEIDKNNVKK
ncbi:VENN motif pre-toxin domain-containing protein [Yersinia kristensenii]|uniref:VENN motif pre-toxin domain-containing protein n=2 Tax=Yersinia TaxID=629 RepID=UPI001E5C7272|nr:VENN motif pre-toxin domain-containing protein [Yersinia kristensenii]